jgi:uncharacterized repeat protein (TIGR02543 family)
LGAIDASKAQPEVKTIAYDETLRVFDNYLTDKVDVTLAQILLTIAGPGSAWDVSRWDWDGWTANHLNNYLSLIDSQTEQVVATVGDGLYWIDLGTNTAIVLGVEPGVLEIGKSYTLRAEAELTGHNVTASLQKAVQWTFETKATDIAAADVEAIGDQVFTDSAIEPSPVVSIATPATSLYSTATQQLVITPASARALVAGTDYTVGYADNVESGTATVTISGIGSFSGSKEVQFTILPAPRKALDDALKAAQDYLDSLIVDSDANNVAQGSSWVTAEAKKALEDAIAEAVAVLNDPLATDSELSDALDALATARQVFESAKQVGTKSNEQLAADDLTVTFNSNGGSKVAAQMFKAGSKISKLPKTARKGYAFKGWYTAKKGGAKLNTNTVVDKDVTYYARWTAKKFTVKLNANKGKIKTKSKTVTFAGKYGKLKSPTKAGYKFAGWYTKKKGGSKITAKTKVKITKTQTLYAHWKKR